MTADKKTPTVPNPRTVKQEVNRVTPDGADNRRLRLVGIGASAGGLEALRELMGSLPDTDAFCYVIAQHVSPTHASMLMSLLAPKTVLRIQDLTDGQTPEGGTVYITPPNRDVIVKNGLLRLTEPAC